jgi:hypothetical protein
MIPDFKTNTAQQPLSVLLITSNAQQKIVQPGSINEVELRNVCNASQKILR